MLGKPEFSYEMGRIKSKLVKRTTHLLLNEENKFTGKYEDNKLLLKNLDTSKKLKNQIAGYLTRIKKREIKVKTE